MKTGMNVFISDVRDFAVGDWRPDEKKSPINAGLMKAPEGAGEEDYMQRPKPSMGAR